MLGVRHCPQSSASVCRALDGLELASKTWRNGVIELKRLWLGRRSSGQVRNSPIRSLRSNYLVVIGQQAVGEDE
jgi:hypothetical protein